MSTDDTVGDKRRVANISNQQLETIVQDKDAKATRRSTLYAEARTVDGELCKNSSLRTTRHELNKYIGSIFDADLTKDAESRESHNVCFAICTDLKGQGFVGVDHHPPVDDSDMKKMYQDFHLSNPKSLQWRGAMLHNALLWQTRQGTS